MSTATNTLFDPRANLEEAINNPHFYDYIKEFVDGADNVPGDVGTIGIIVMPHGYTTYIDQNLGTGAITTNLVGEFTFTNRGTTVAYADNVAASFVVPIYSHNEPFFIPGDFERIQVSSDKLNYIVIRRELRQYE